MERSFDRIFRPFLAVESGLAQPSFFPPVTAKPSVTVLFMTALRAPETMFFGLIRDELAAFIRPEPTVEDI